MAMNAQETVIGVFDDRGLADKAVEELRIAEFSSSQIYYSGSGENPKNDFWQGIKSLFTHGKATSHDALAYQLKDLGLSDDEIRHYDDEYHSGRTIVAVKTPSREQEALVILRANGAHN
jgi:hypothetical protein